MKKLAKIAIIIAIIIAIVSSISVQAFAATPLYKPVKLPTYTITVPHYDFSYAVEQYLEEHPLDIG